MFPSSAALPAGVALTSLAPLLGPLTILAVLAAPAIHTWADLAGQYVAMNATDSHSAIAMRQRLHQDLRLLLRTNLDRLGHESFRLSGF